MKNIIEVKGLEKSYGNVKAVKGINFSVEEGSFFAFLGTNGAGKSTTIDTLCTLLKCEKGEVLIDGYKLGKDDKEIRKRIGVVFQNSVLDGFLTVEENLMSRGSFYKYSKEKLKERVKKVAEVTEIQEIMKRRYSRLSGGQRRRVDIARALIQEPKILFLDEPTTGLDPKTRKSIWESIVNMQKKTGMTVFLTTHYMEEAAIADNITVIKSGEIIESGTPAYLKDKYTKDRLILYVEEQESKEVLEYLQNGGYEYVTKPDAIWVMVDETKDSLKIINDVIDKINSFEVIKGTMDDVFLNIIGEGGV